ncbi:MAG TPA: SAM-dependent methyltransferase, partial [Blastocatellia bacterium]|nr:SAM-dependent methyltransferase [Blastocatellia bacterium]
NAQPREIEESEDELLVKVAEFAERVQQKLNYWKQHLSEMQQQNKKVAVWGSGSKCVAFLTSLHAADAVQCVIDINPHRHGKFIPGVAKEIMSPEYLKTFMPDEVLVMNPIYVNEIGRMLDEMGVRTQLVPV